LFSGSFEEPYYKEFFAEHILELIQQMDRGEPPLNIGVGTPKDEIISKKKMEDGLVRIFFSGNVEFFVLSKRYLSPFFEICMKMRHVLPGQIGMNAIGQEFNTRLWSMYKSVYPEGTYQEFLQDNVFIDTDFAKFDKCAIATPYAITLIWWIMCESEFYQNNPIEKQRLKLILQSHQEFVLLLENNIFICDVGQASGVNGTTPINCFIEFILEVVQFYFVKHIYETQSIPVYGNFVSKGYVAFDIFKHISLINFGDDNVKVLSKTVSKWYTHEAIKEFARFISMDITPSQKHEKQIQLKNVTQIMFLKRFPTYIERLRCVVGRLDFTSIGKMLAFSDSKDPNWKSSVLAQATREMSYYPKEDFDRFCKIFSIEASYEYVQDTCLTFTWTDRSDEPPDCWEQVKSEYLSRAKAVPALTTKQADSTDTIIFHSGVSGVF